MYIRITNLKKAKPRQPLDMHIRIANLRKFNPGNHWIYTFGFPIEKRLTQETIGYAHSDCQSKNRKTRKPSDMHIRIANLRMLNARNIGYKYSGCQS